jgi:hypothetical protein
MSRLNIFLLVLGLLIIGVSGYLFFSSSPIRSTIDSEVVIQEESTTEEKEEVKNIKVETSNKVYPSQEECEQQSKRPCRFQMCDYIPSDQTPEDVCGGDKGTGWTAKVE